MTFDPSPIGLNEEEAAAAFGALQPKLVPLWKSIQSFNQDAQTIVVVPSLSVDNLPVEGSLLQAYEERFLFLLLLLRQPRARLIYVTSQAIRPEIADYYLHLLPGVIASHARKRLFLVSPLDGARGPLSQKLLDRPHLIRQIRSLIPDPDRAHLVPFNTTHMERDLAVRLGIPMYGADPKFFPLGTKSGARQLFAEAGVNHPLGVENIHSTEDAVAAIKDMRARKPGIRQVIVKLNEGVSGYGNALVHLEGLPASGEPAEAAAIRERLQAMILESHAMSYDDYMQTLARNGGIVEERITGDEFRSPSAQMRITPLGKLELLSTHDQLLGGTEGQTYLGCRFPADPAYAAAIMTEAAKVGQRLVKEGVLGRFAMDFVAVRSQGGPWEVYAIELNLRKGGTTHPFLTLQFLTDGAYDAAAGVFRTPRGEEKCFVASDTLASPAYRVFTPDDLFDVVARHGLHFDQTHQTGAVFHMMSALGEHGRLGLTAVGNTQAEADAIYARVVAALDTEAQAALSG